MSPVFFLDLYDNPSSLSCCCASARFVGVVINWVFSFPPSGSIYVVESHSIVVEGICI